MNEKLFKTAGFAGVLNLVLGVMALIIGLVSGVLLLVSGSKLIKNKKEVMF